jgi:methylenetetrahydrofolate reductase (NADPH)
MNISKLFKEKRVYSFEIFPPKKTSPIDTIYNTLEELKGLSPDFISVTYGAGGSSNKDATIEIASAIKNKYKVESVAHLPCIYLTKKNVSEMLEEFKNKGIENILALRGDVNPDIPPQEDFKYASDLISFIKQNADFNTIGACYPEGHTESKSLKEDIKNLKHKVDAGANHLITQLFFDNNCFYYFLEQARKEGIHVPIQAGIMPVTNKNQIEKIVRLSGASLPEKFTNMLDKYENKPQELRKAGIEYAIEQILDLISQDVDGIHLYTMNNADVAKKVTEAIRKAI